MTTPIETLAVSIATKTFSGLLSNLVSNYLLRNLKKITGDAGSIGKDLRPHLEVTFEKCLNMKTIINDASVNMLSIYVEQRFKHKGENIDQYDLIDSIRQGKSVVITGTGGGGKSMFMRYIWLSFFAHSEQKIPIFFDLRQVNSVTHENFTDYLYHSILQTKSKIDQNQFDQSISAGEFVLFLDGFDEITLEKREFIESEIIALKDNNPQLTIVVTSRPDDRFMGWHRFDNVDVSPLTKEDALLLIDRAIYDDTSKRRLHKRVKGGLFESHESFLSNPLLVYMMLLTIARNPDIPNKMHAFYEMAFDALYHRHDTSKGGYIRQFYTRLEKHQFIKYLCYFCLITYHDQCTEADEIAINDYVQKSLNFEGVEIESNSYLRDLVESVCIIKKDGIQYNFIHRSFQEYFAALCICRFASRNLEKLFLEFSRRHNDKVLSMVYDINPDLFREKYILPINEKYKTYFSPPENINEAIQFLEMSEATFKGIWHTNPRINSEKTGTKINVSKNTKRISISLDGDSDLYGLCSNIDSIVPKSSRLNLADEDKIKRNLDTEFFTDLTNSLNMAANVIQLKAMNGKLVAISGPSEFILDDHWEEKFKKTYMHEYCTRESIKTKEFVERELANYARITSSFDEYL